MTQEEIQQKAYEVYPLDLDRHMIIEGEPYDNNKEKREAYIRGLTDSKPSLPSNLDEAARKYGHEEPILPEGYNDGDIPLYERWTADAFKAGAEWMARQGWFSVDESLPKMAQEVIVLTDEIGTAPIYKINFGHIVDVNRCIDYNGWNIPGVKYWMPCPKIPGMND